MATSSSGSSSMVALILAIVGVVIAIVALVLVGVAYWYLNRKIDRKITSSSTTNNTTTSAPIYMAYLYSGTNGDASPTYTAGTPAKLSMIPATLSTQPPGTVSVDSSFPSSAVAFSLASAPYVTLS